MFEDQLNLQFFKESGFTRKICKKCKSAYWTTSASRDTCGDAPCDEYDFIGAPITKKPYDLASMRSRFINFFEQRGHKPIRRYPVVARWRTDIYLTIASIADFQPHVTSGESKPPANPLVISQPCIRLNDITAVGKTGRHLTNFEMMAHHAFNTPREKIYWTEDCVRYCHTFLTKVLDIDSSRITYKENPWSGGGNAGPALEVMVGGLEVATLVFMNMKADKYGQYEIKGEKFSKMELNIIDTGYGLERLVWASQGTPTIYDAVHPQMVSKLCEMTGISKKIEHEDYKMAMGEWARLSGQVDPDTASGMDALRKNIIKRVAKKGGKIYEAELKSIMNTLENIYLIADHTRCLAFMLGDNIVPSNVKGGYLARLVARKTMRAIENLGLNTTVDELVSQQLEIMSKDFPELYDSRTTVSDMLKTEAQKYAETTSKGELLVMRHIKSKKQFDIETLVDLYDSHGLPPEFVKKIAAANKHDFDIPEDFYSKVAERHMKGEEKEEEKQEEYPKDLPETKLLYYDDVKTREFDAVVLWCKDGKAILDRTAFYPEGGGQPGDVGSLSTRERMVDVKDTQKAGKLVIHNVSGSLRVGDVVHGTVNSERRQSLMQHHTGTHVINGAARAVLGQHIWQWGAQKGTDRSRIDISHYKRITPEELNKIELLANKIVMDAIQVERTVMDRDVAESRYGFRLYQGGVPPGNKIRVVRIADFDVEACAGTHCTNTSEVGPIKILRTERIQDGVERIEFSAGLAAIRQIQETEKILNETSETFGVPVDQLTKTAKRFFNEWKEYKKKVEESLETVATRKVPWIMQNAEQTGKLSIATDVWDADMDELIATAAALVKPSGVVAVLGGNKDGGKLVVACSQDVEVDCNAILKEAAKIIGGSGGGRKNFAQGGGPLSGNIEEAVKTAVKKVKESPQAKK
ncbi:MAG: alanine--tRNA ligase [Candidatus Thermoplasmatota archaeon]|nr:alanine--tRNA ligase [Candidatus Thermoplasmatota archaeon]